MSKDIVQFSEVCGSFFHGIGVILYRHKIGSAASQIWKALQRGPLTRDLCNLSWALAAVRGQASPLMVETIEGSSWGVQTAFVGVHQV